MVFCWKSKQRKTSISVSWRCLAYIYVIQDAFACICVILLYTLVCICDDPYLDLMLCFSCTLTCCVFACDDPYLDLRCVLPVMTLTCVFCHEWWPYLVPWLDVVCCMFCDPYHIIEAWSCRIQWTLTNLNDLGPEPVWIREIIHLNGQPYDFQLTHTKITMDIVNMHVRISEGSDY